MINGALYGAFSVVEVFRCISYLLGGSTSCPSLEPWISPNTTNHFDFSPNIRPVQCHSHNDYWHRNPLYDALSAGCVGVEADVWLFEDDLFVGHSTNELTRDRTFRSLYVDPLVTLLDQPAAEVSGKEMKCPLRGLFEQDQCQTLVLLVDYKNDGHTIHPVVRDQLGPLREKGYLTYFDGNRVVPGPVTVVGTGHAPLDLLTVNVTYRDIFFDAPLARLYEQPADAQLDTKSVNYEEAPSRGYLVGNTTSATETSYRITGQGSVGTTSTSQFDTTNSYYASANFRKAIGIPWRGRLSEEQIQRLRGQVLGAKRRGLKTRYWGVPSWPVGLRNTVWETLVREGVDMLAGDDLMGMARGTWWGGDD